MDYATRIHSDQAYAQAREQAFKARAKRARRWARLITLALFTVFLTAVWQNRALAPPVHDGMVLITDKVQYALENSDSAREFVRQSLSSPSGTSRQSEFDPITTWLLKWRN